MVPIAALPDSLKLLFLNILITTRMKPLMFSFQKIKVYLNINRIRQKNSTHNKMYI